MLFIRGKYESTIIIKQPLDIFFSLSRLEANDYKSLIFVVCSDIHFKASMHSIFGFQLGTLLVRYLGVPLISTKLSSSDYKVLVEKIVARIRSWTSKCLSYAGRLQLMISILSSFHIYWSILFILPKKITNRI